MARLLAVLAILDALSTSGAWAQAVEGDEGFMDLTLPDLSPATVDPDGTYVDPQIRNRGECLDHPGRPAWVMVQPKGMEWRGEIMRIYGQLQINLNIVETGNCSCDNRYPDWETFKPAMQEMLAPFDQVQERDLPPEQHTAVRRLRSEMRRERSQIGYELGKTCRGTS